MLEGLTEQQTSAQWRALRIPVVKTFIRLKIFIEVVGWERRQIEAGLTYKNRERS